MTARAWAAALATTARCSGDRSTMNRQACALAPEGAQVAACKLPIDSSREFAAALRRNNWPVELAELAADHGSIAGATYDLAADRYAAAEDEDTLAVAADVAAHIAAVA